MCLPLRMLRGLAFGLGLVAASNSAGADAVDYVRDVRPILQKHCSSCHGAEKHKSGLRLDIRSEAFKGGDGDGPAIVAGQVVESPLIRRIEAEDEVSRMPPSGDPLSPAEIATLKSWIKEGAAWPDGVDLARLEDRRDHWSFKPVKIPTVAAADDDAWSRNPIDRMILGRLHQEGLTPAPEAGRAAWIRRVSFDLIGLPPTPEQVAAFIRDGRPDAFERIVENLLASPHYGERWAQHWLDVVRYADTHGFEVNTERPNAWPYRDYVIESFNSDTPYDRFIREQLVGDALGKDAATGFLVTASVLLPGQIGADDVSKRLARQDAIDEIVVNIGQTFLGLSIGCARCHDHKFDPITARDYYSMQAFVAGVEYGDRELRTPESLERRRHAATLKTKVAELDQALTRYEPLAQPGRDQIEASNPSPNGQAVGDGPPLRLALNARLNSDRFAPIPARRVRFTIIATNQLEPCIDELEILDTTGRNVALASAGAAVRSSGDTVVAGRHELGFVHDGKYGNSHSWMSSETGKGWVEIDLGAERTIQRVTWGRDRQGEYQDRLAIDYRIEAAAAGGAWRVVADSSDRHRFTGESSQPAPASYSTVGLGADELRKVRAIEAERKALEAQIAAASREGLAFAGIFRKPDRIHLLNRGDPEQPKEEVVPALLSALGESRLSAESGEQDRRRVLADWITSPENPLTARVMVNRVWQGHFGVGLVETASDFGRMGTRPSHPDLLDWLTAEFIRSGWSIKHVHRLIVLSAAYRQSNRFDASAASKDVDARLLWRFPSRRLDAETIRDSMLAVGGGLDLKMGGSGFDLFDKRGGLTGFTPIESFRGEGLRRMIYAHKVRRERDAVFGAFDCPDAGQSTARRRESTTPIQALNLFNSRFTMDQADAFAARLARDAGADVDGQVRRAFQLALTRDPSEVEAADARRVVADFGVATLCRVLLNCNEFLYMP